MSDDHVGLDFRDELRKLSDLQLEDLYVRLRAIASRLLRHKLGYEVRAVEAEDLVHHAYLVVAKGGRRGGSARSLIQFFAGVMWSELDHIVRKHPNKAPHLSIVRPEEVEPGTISSDQFRAPPGSDPEAQTIVSELKERIAGLFGKPDVRRYIAHRENDDGGTEAEDAAALDLPEARVRNIKRSLARGFRRLRPEGG